MLHNILNSGFDFEDHEYELKTKYILLNSMLFMTAIVLIFIGIFRTINADHQQAFIDFWVTAVALFYCCKFEYAEKLFSSFAM